MVLTKNYFTFPLYLPRIYLTFINWKSYIKNYVLKNHKPQIYYLRNGMVIRDATGSLTGTLAVVFIRREYGFISSFDKIVDIGANMGAFALFAATSNPKSKVFCYEPESKNFDYLNENIKLNNLHDRISTFKLAIAGESGNRNLEIGRSPLHTIMRSNTENNAVNVEATTIQKILDENHIDKLDLLKVNCEGAEYEIFEKCNETTLSRVKNIRMEYHNIKNTKYNGKYVAKIIKRKGFKEVRYTKYKDQSGFVWFKNSSSFDR